MINFFNFGRTVEEEVSPPVQRFDDRLKPQQQQVKFSASTCDFGADSFSPTSDDSDSNVTTGESQRDFSFSKYGFTPSVDRITKTNKSTTQDSDCLDIPSVPKQISGSKNIDIAPTSSMSRPNYEDIIKRVAVVTHRHVQKCEERLRNASENVLDTGLFHSSQMELFNEERYLLPKFCYDFTTAPITRLGFQYTIRKLKPYYKAAPTFTEIHDFLKETFDKAQLTAECSIVCLIYCERLMENAHVPLVTQTWRPVLLCCLLLASKVWQDQGTWNIDMADIFPQYSLQNINKLERTFCAEINWDLYISPSVYAKYYFALRSITAEKDFRRNYNMMIHIPVPGAEMVANRSEDLRSHVLAKSL